MHTQINTGIDSAGPARRRPRTALAAVCLGFGISSPSDALCCPSLERTHAATRRQGARRQRSGKRRAAPQTDRTYPESEDGEPIVLRRSLVDQTADVQLVDDLAQSTQRLSDKPRSRMLADVDDEALARVACRGGTAGSEAFSELVRRHRPQIVRLADHLLSNCAEAEDVAQEAFVRAYLAFDRFPMGANFEAWMRVVVTRLAYNHRRDKKTRNEYYDQLEVSRSTQDNIAEREALTKVLDDVSCTCREIIVLKYVREMSVREIANALDLGLSATKMRLLRAREQFNAVWGRETNPPLELTA